MDSIKEHLSGIDFKEDAALFLGETALMLAATVWLNHQKLSHQSLALTPPAETITRGAMWGIGIKPRIWADVHQRHHGYPDANFGPVLEAADFLEWLDAH